MYTRIVMPLEIFSATAGLRMYDLIDEISEAVKDEACSFLAPYNIFIRFIIRCVPSENDKQVIRYLKKERRLLIDYSVPYADYEKLYITERRFELGESFIAQLQNGLDNRSFRSDNPDFPYAKFFQHILDLGKKQGLFPDEIDYTKDVRFD